MTPMKKYLLKNLAIAAMSGVFIGPVLWLKDKAVGIFRKR